MLGYQKNARRAPRGSQTQERAILKNDLDLPERISGRIQEARLRAGLSQAELASRIGVHRNSIAGWESGRDITIVNLCRIAAALGLRLKELLG